MTQIQQTLFGLFLGLLGLRRAQLTAKPWQLTSKLQAAAKPCPWMLFLEHGFAADKQLRSPKVPSSAEARVHRGAVVVHWSVDWVGSGHAGLIPGSCLSFPCRLGAWSDPCPMSQFAGGVEATTPHGAPLESVECCQLKGGVKL